jgi:hypothetical protein
MSGKSLELSKLEIEVEALRIAAVLSDDSEFGSDTAPASTRWTAPTRPVQVPKAANADPPRARLSLIRSHIRATIVVVGPCPGCGYDTTDLTPDRNVNGRHASRSQSREQTETNSPARHTKDDAAAVCPFKAHEVPGRWRYKRRRELFMCAGEEKREGGVGSPAGVICVASFCRSPGERS